MTRPTSLLASCCFAAGLLFSGCATTAPATYRSAAAAPRLAPPPTQVRVAPLDIELSELTASGAIELQSEWTTAAAINLARLLTEKTGFQPHDLTGTADLEMSSELAEVAPLVQAMNINQINARFANPGAGPVPPAALARPFDYATGPLVAHQNSLGDGAVLFLYLRDSYATGGRKALAALSIVGAAFTGVAITPTMGSTIATATLVDHKGNVLWMNQTTMPMELRTPEGIENLLKVLLDGLPTSPPSAP